MHPHSKEKTREFLYYVDTLGPNQYLLFSLIDYLHAYYNVRMICTLSFCFSVSIYINGMVDNIRVFFYFQLLSKMIVPTHIWSLALSVLNLVSRVALSDSSFKSRLPGKSANYLSWFYRKILDIRSKPKGKKNKKKQGTILSSSSWFFSEYCSNS